MTARLGFNQWGLQSTTQQRGMAMVSCDVKGLTDQRPNCDVLALTQMINFNYLFLWDAGRRLDFEYVGLVPPPPLAPFLRIAAWS